MEEYGYNYAVNEKGYKVPLYIDPLDPSKGYRKALHMKDLFNMTAGTSTGSILAAGLSVPSVDNASNP
jgi:hypothetical protein